MKRETTFTYTTTNKKNYALINYEEIIGWYNLPFYKRWFTKKPIKQLMDI